MSLNKLYIFLLFILTGIVIGIVFDIFRIFRRSFKTNDIITYVQDFLFWLVTGCILLFSIFTFNNGGLRGDIFIGIILGVLLHLLLLSKYFINIFVDVYKRQIVDLKAKSASLTQKGIKKAEEEFGLENFNDIENSEIVHNVNQALRAHGIMKKDIDYIVKDGEVLIVDEFTGRIMYGLSLIHI